MRTYAYGYGTWATRLTLTELGTKTTWKNLSTEFRRRLLAMFDHGQDVLHDVGIGGGWRSSAQQEQVFRSRYDVVPCPGQISWNGQCWAKKPGVAPSAPPGRSYHESVPPNDGGIAGDLIGDIAWADGVAHLFGLRSLADLLPPNNEAWHFQPVEVATARRNYDGRALPVFPLPGEQPPPPPPPPDEEDEMLEYVLIPKHDDAAAWWPWLACYTSGVVRPLGPGPSNVPQHNVTDIGQYRRICAAAGIQLVTEEP